MSRPLYELKPRPLRELAALRQLVRLPGYWMDLGREPRGAANVMVIPGFMTSDRSTWLLRKTLTALGHRVRGWGLGRNHGDVDVLMDELRHVVKHAARDEPVHLIGWSLGGYLAREVARDEPGAVAQVITLAAPVVGGPKYTAAARYYRARGVDLEALERRVVARETVPLRVPITALYSPTDAVVCPGACIDRVSANVRHIEVRSSHAGFGFSRDVYSLLARCLVTEAAGS